MAESENNNQNGFDFEANTARLRKKRRVTAIILTALLLLGSNAAFFALGRTLGGGDYRVSVEDAASAAALKKLLYIKTMLEDSFLFDMDEAAMWEAATNAFVDAAGDKYTRYMSTKEYAEYKTAGDESFEGIGVQVQDTDESNVLVVYVYIDTPADHAGLRVGDIITAVDGESMLGRGIDYAVTKLRGPAESDVLVTIDRGGETLNLNVKRDLINISYVMAKMLDNNIGYIHMSGFETNGDTDFEKYLNQFVSDGMRALIIDLRANPGGYVYVALNIADQLLGECEMIYTLDKNGKKLADYSDSEVVDVPVVVLVNGNSASASEILAGTLQENGGAVLLGTKTYGKGIIQQPVELSDGSYFTFTIQQYYLPSGTAVHHVGLTPDYVVEPDASGTDNQFERALELAEQLAKERE